MLLKCEKEHLCLTLGKDAETEAVLFSVWKYAYIEIAKYFCRFGVFSQDTASVLRGCITQYFLEKIERISFKNMWLNSTGSSARPDVGERIDGNIDILLYSFYVLAIEIGAQHSAFKYSKDKADIRRQLADAPQFVSLGV